MPDDRPPPLPANDLPLYQWKGVQRTDLHCHDCNRNFIGVVDYDITGWHVVECPACGHKHYRKIVAGRVTEQRYDSDATTTVTRDQSIRDMWKSNTVPMVTATTKSFLRDAWLNRHDDT